MEDIEKATEILIKILLLVVEGMILFIWRFYRTNSVAIKKPEKMV
jgi:hypothetical protein